MKFSMKTAILSLIIFWLHPQITSAQCHINDWTALKALYESAGGDFWTNRTGWNTIINNQNTPPANCNLANLYGVELSNGRVVCIDFDGIDNCEWDQFGSGNNLVGNLNAEIDKLSNLTILNLYRNQLNGSIPVQLGDLSNLTYLNLNESNLSGSIPSQLGNLTNLTYFDAYSNELSGFIPPEIGNLNNLAYLDLSSNQLAGSLPSELGNLSNLTRLDLSSNFIGGSIPPETGNLSNLTFMNLSRNNFTGSLPAELGNLSNLEILYLHYNLLSGNIPPEIGNLNNLETLYLQFNNLSGPLPAELGNLSNLITLEVQNNNLFGCYWNNLMNFCTQLTFLQDNGNSTISEGNNFDATWEDFCATAAAECIGGNQPVVCHIDDWTALKAFYEDAIGDNWTNRSGWDIMINNQNSPPANCDLSSLFGVHFDEQGRVDLINLPNNNLNGSISPEIDKLSNLSWLILNNNQLSGSIPAQMGNLSNLSVLELNSNKFTGTIPPELGNLSNLLSLRLQNNLLIGNLPDQLSNLSNLIALFVNNNNNLSGCYPQSYSTLCGQLLAAYSVDTFISDGNNFDASWQDFCTTGAGACNCPSNLVITSSNPFQNLYQSNSISTSGPVEISSGQQVEYRANNVTLNQGFSVKAGADFQVRYGTCN